MCVLLLTVGVSVGVVGSGASEVERGGGRAMLVVSGCVMIEEEEGEGEGEGVDAMRLGVSTTVKFSMTRTPEPDMFVILSMSVIFSVGSTEGVGKINGADVNNSCVEVDTVGVNACVELGLGMGLGVGLGVGLGTEVVSFWARMTGHRTRRRRRGEGKESSSDLTIFNLQWEKGGECDISKEGGREVGR